MKNAFSALSKERICFLLALFVTVGFIFYAPYLPMVDLPQHASQVSTLDDLLKNKSVWADMLTLNWDTPYLAGYGLWWLLYQFFDIVLSSKILISIIFLFYIYTIHLLRKSFHAPALLEWAVLPTFFGFAFQWGFITFLLAIPVGLLFFLTCKHWLETQKTKYLIQFALLGLLMYVCHVLIFAFFCFVSYAYFLVAHAKQLHIKKSIYFTLPYLVYALIFYRYLTRPTFWEFRYYQEDFVFVPLLKKTADLLYMPWNMAYLDYYNLANYFILISPVLLGLKPHKHIKYYMPLLAFLMIWYALPAIGFQTNFVYHRFAIFFIPFYFLMWQQRQNLSTTMKNVRQLSQIAFFMVTLALMWKFYDDQIKFKKEPALIAYQQISHDMVDNKRVLLLHGYMKENSSTGMNSNMEYLYFANWYQAQKHGWVDFNFASFHSQIVRFKKDHFAHLKNRSASKEGIEITDCTNYDYLLLKTDDEPNTILSWLSNNSTCQTFKFSSQYSDWVLFERHSQPIHN